ncbi:MULTISPECIES: pyruvate kinase [Bradyrhizobium]|uniref:Pyruvate kinase n=3 Tax=Bradyrhizobium TaxID=374 RepID=A0AAE5X8K4_9BRAD|nr:MULTISPECIES: pyruvate kinase [Bradyrhizobium]MCG2633160.1 pyruvate kinase [Bradyrhizobium zhengyangense]MCG2645756.1 pyruvate kinase [Bradyrhizobium zhengyangense]MCG2673388.1 pyruvate kinase [Bradyrhizobium zhengyangense]MDN4985363.1 pyruvate kinase [Bradyrhizobium sp. WYCCWR 13022]MDN5006320.1 pyruvate kinase [Bradyrhizobium sp. WYCCWR 12677]
MRRSRHAKIVATLGPATTEANKIRDLYLAGTDTFRLNFSHGSQDDHARAFSAIRALEQEFGRPIGVLQDLQGPKIRIGLLEEGKLCLHAGESVRFVLDGARGGKQAIPLPHPEIFAAAHPGQKLLIDDGRVRLSVERPGDREMVARVIVGGPIRDHKGVNLPGASLDISPLTKKDRADLAFGLELGVDWVALSFVQKPSDLIEARALIGEAAGLVAKIETPMALDRIDDIIQLSDALMVGRGDLGVEIPPEDVPGRQKELVRACRLAAKPVIVATQMLDSMVAAPTPTRAEASDVATAIYDGADAVMLSAESASGAYPIEAVAMMDRIIRSTEQHRLYRSLIEASRVDEENTPPHAVAAAGADLAATIEAKAIVGFTASGTTAARISRKRPPVPILALTQDENVARRMCLLWGVHSVVASDPSGYEEITQIAAVAAQREGYARSGDLAVVVFGLPFGHRGATNNLRVAAC